MWWFIVACHSPQLDPPPVPPRQVMANPAEVRRWVIRAVGAEELGDDVEAERAWRWALREAPNDADVKRRFAAFLVKTGRPALALPYVEAAPDVASQLVVGQIYAANGDVGRAYRVLTAWVPNSDATELGYHLDLAVALHAWDIVVDDGLRIGAPTDLLLDAAVRTCRVAELRELAYHADDEWAARVAPFAGDPWLAHITGTPDSAPQACVRDPAAYEGVSASPETP